MSPALHEWGGQCTRFLLLLSSVLLVESYTIGYFMKENPVVIYRQVCVGVCHGLTGLFTYYECNIMAMFVCVFGVSFCVVIICLDPTHL